MLPITLVPAFLSDPSRSETEIKRQAEWNIRDFKVESFSSDLGQPYVYGTGHGQRSHSPKPWVPEVSSIRQKVENFTKTTYETCHLNVYQLYDHLGWHSDNSPQVDGTRSIAIVNLGTEREIWFRPIMESDVEKRTLAPGSLLIMQPGMQDLWQYRIPKSERAGAATGETSLILTFRGFR